MPGAKSSCAVSTLWTVCACLIVAGCAAGKDELALPSQQDLIAAAKSQSAARGDARAALPVASSQGTGAVIETGALQDRSVAATGAGAPRPAGADQAAAVAVADANAAEELFIDFQPGALTLSEREQAAMREAVAAKLLGGNVRLRVSAGRGSSGNMFQQTLVAEKRARFVNQLLPNRMIDSVEVDPALPDDTVRIEFKKPPKV